MHEIEWEQVLWLNKQVHKIEVMLCTSFQTNSERTRTERENRGRESER